MFFTAYITLILFAGLPLARTLLEGRGSRSGVIYLHRLYRDVTYIAVAVAAIICFETALRVSLQNYWFAELGQRYRYWLALGLRTGIFLALLVSVAAALMSRQRFTCRTRSRRLASSPRTAVYPAHLHSSRGSSW